MSHTFQAAKNYAPEGVKLSVQTVYDLMFSIDRPMTCKTIGSNLGIDTTIERNLKDISNRCSYLVSQGFAERVDKGTYALTNKGRNAQEGNGMTMTDTPLNGSTLAEAPTPTLPERFQCPECDFVGRSQMGIRAHMTRTHKKGLSHNEAFDRVAEATKILFPDPNDVYDRLEEIAALRKEMFKAVTR